jgi:hypothetical protein
MNNAPPTLIALAKPKSAFINPALRMWISEVCAQIPSNEQYAMGKISNSRLTDLANPLL